MRDFLGEPSAAYETVMALSLRSLMPVSGSSAGGPSASDRKVILCPVSGRCTVISPSGVPSQDMGQRGPSTGSTGTSGSGTGYVENHAVLDDVAHTGRVQNEPLVECGGPAAPEQPAASSAGTEVPFEDERQRSVQGDIDRRHDHFAGGHVDRVTAR
ncbi:hypothetical protein SHIRM173S_04011 [Streptomyces hirsutus]